MIKFTKDMEIGISIIDEQHKELVDLINNITSMGIKSTSKEEVEKTLDFLGQYVVKHFNDEETLQRQYSYPDYERHKNIHKDFITDFVKFKEEFHAQGTSIKFAMTLNNFIVAWIVKHIKNADAAFGKFFKEKMK